MLWQHGYFRQSIGPDGRQQALYPVNDTRQMPIEPLHDASGAPLRLAIQLPGLQIWLRGWQARVGRHRLLLLDTNDPAFAEIIALAVSLLAIAALFEQKTARYIFINGGYALLALTLMGAIIGVWR